MKNKTKLLPLILFFSLLPMGIFSSCDKDTFCYLDVNVTDAATKKAVSGVKIEVKQDGGNVHANGVTDKEGHFTTHFVAPAIITIKADLPVANNGHRKAETSVRLKDGETVTAQILLPTTVTY